MVKLVKLALGAVGVTAAAWSGGWFYGKSEIRSQIDAQVVELSKQGIAASYKSLEINGFPFAYRGRLVEPKTQANVVTGQGPARADWQTPVVTFDSSLADFGVVNFTMPETQTGRITPSNGSAPMDFAVRSNGLTGQLAQEGERVSVKGGGETIEVEVTPQDDTPSFLVTVARLALSAVSPIDEPGRITAAVELDDATANEDAWQLFDPTRGFPRDPVNLRFSATADTALRSDNSIEVRAMTLNHVEADVAGMTMAGQGDAVVTNRRPEGEMTLRFSGLGGFLANAATAGFLPKSQADLASTMLNTLAKAGENEGEQIYKIEFKKGFIFINGSTTFIPAPVLP